MAGMREAIALGALGVLVGACGSGYREGPEPVANTAPPVVKVDWAGEATVYDVLGRDPSLIQAVQVPARRLPRGTTVRPAGTGAPFQVATTCDEGACVDGILLDGVTWLRPELTADDREILSEDGSWLERGVKIVHAEPGLVSYYVGLAHYTGGAAHSHAQMSCHTQTAPDRAATLAILPAGDGAALIAAVNAFLAEARESHDDRVRGDIVIDARFADFRDGERQLRAAVLHRSVGHDRAAPRRAPRQDRAPVARVHAHDPSEPASHAHPERPSTRAGLRPALARGERRAYCGLSACAPPSPPRSSSPAAPTTRSPLGPEIRGPSGSSPSRPTPTDCRRADAGAAYRTRSQPT